MSPVPEGWGEPTSWEGLLYDLGWIGLAIAVFAAISFWGPLDVQVDPSETEQVVATLVGVVLGLTLPPLLSTDHWRARWRDGRLQFAVLFGGAVLVQAGLYLAPTSTVVTASTGFLAAVPSRIYVYLRASGSSTAV